MRIVPICLAAFVLALALPVFAKTKAPSVKEQFPRQEAVLKWINGYRAKPEPELLPVAVKAMGDLGLLRELDNAGVYTGFIAGVLSNNGDKAERLISAMFPMPPEDQVILVKAIAFSGLPEWKPLLSAFVERMPARKVLMEKYLYGDGKTLFELPLNEGSFVLDAHWGYYFGSGSQQAIKRIVSALAWSTDKNDVEKLTIGAMAKWTVASNASRDKELLDAVKAEMNTQPEEVRAPLREAILAAETFEFGRIRKYAMASIDELKAKGPEQNRNFAWWGQTGQTVLALGCVAASVTGHVELGLPCVVGGALSTAALKYLTPQ